MLSLTRIGLLLVLLGTVSGGCDGQANETADDPIAVAKRYVEVQQAALGSGSNFAQRGGSSGVNAELLTRFYPDWEKGSIIKLSGGRSAIAVDLGPDARVRFDSSVVVLRSLVVTVEANGEVSAGNILEFVSPDKSSITSSVELVEMHLSGDFGGRRIMAGKYDLGYKPLGGIVYLSGGETRDVEISVVECDKKSSGYKRSIMATTEVCHRVAYFTNICAGEPEYCGTGWNVTIETTCWKVEDGGEGGEPGGSNGGGTGPGGSNGGGPSFTGDDTVPSHLDPPDCSKVQKEQALIDYCRSLPPSTAQEIEIGHALVIIGGRGGVCQQIANEGSRLLSEGKIKIYRDSPGAVVAAWWSPDINIILGEWAMALTGTIVYDANDASGQRGQKNLQSILVHEIEHSMGARHDISGWRTPNSGLCSGLAFGRPAL